MRWKMKYNYKRLRFLTIIISYLLVSIFSYSSCQKLFYYDIFLINLKRSPMIISSLAIYISYIIIIIEILIPILLAFNKTRKWGFFISFFLIFLFTGYILLTITYSPYLPCSCGGLIERLSWSGHMIFNGFLLLLSFVGFKICSLIT
jgi:hypothetical protein